MTYEAIETAEQVFNALGGNAAVEIITSSKPSTVSNWRSFGTFPSNTYVAMTEALAARGKSAPPSLWGMKAPVDPAPATTEAS